MCGCYRQFGLVISMRHTHFLKHSRLCRVVWWLKYSLGKSVDSVVSTQLHPLPHFFQLPSHNDRPCDTGEKAAPTVHGVCHHSHHCTWAFSQDIQHPGKWGILLRIPLSSLRKPKQGWKSLLGAFQSGWSPDTAALCTSQSGQRPLSWRLHISAFTGLLCSCQLEQHNAHSAQGRPLPSHFPTKHSKRTLLTNHSTAAGGSSPL